MTVTLNGGQNGGHRQWREQLGHDHRATVTANGGVFNTDHTVTGDVTQNGGVVNAAGTSTAMSPSMAAIST